MKACVRLLCVGLCAGLSGAVLADRGSIPFTPNVKVFEPNQRAMIAWDGREEILVLSTDLRASAPTRVLEVIPLPAEPAVKKGDVEVFRKATAFINRKLREKALATASLGRARAAAPDSARGPEPAGEITFHEKIGAHDIAVTRVRDAEGFVEWVVQYLETAGAVGAVIPDVLQRSVEAYLEEGFGWFVFDVVALDNVPRTNDAIEYRFRTDRLFYPLKISRTGSGGTRIELIVLTPKLLTRFDGIPTNAVRLQHEPIPVSSRELAALHAEMDGFFKHRDDLKLRIWLVAGDLTSFERDLLAR